MRAGASSGIGEACAWRFAEAGCKLILSARRTERLNALSKQLTESYKVSTASPCNVRLVTWGNASPNVLKLPQEAVCRCTLPCNASGNMLHSSII